MSDTANNDRANRRHHRREHTGPLDGIRVIALEQSVAAPVASRILADAGADVIKVEPPQGDFSRRWDKHAKGQSSHFTWLSRRKRSIALDLRDPPDREIFDRLLTSADVLIYNLAVESAERLGFAPDYFKAHFPKLVVCQITGYGRTGEAHGRRAYDMLVQAESGLLGLTGDELGPVRIGVSISDIGTGLYATSLILTALFERNKTGLGRFLDLSMFEAMTEFIGPNLTAYANSGVRYTRYRDRHHNIVPYGIFPCKDGHIAIAIQQDSEWKRLLDCLERPDLLMRDDLRTNIQRVSSRAEVEREVENSLVSRSRSEWRERFDRAGIAYGLLQDIGAVWESSVEHDLSLHGIARLSDGTEVSVPVSPGERCFGDQSEAWIPSLDEHRLEILTELDLNVAPR